MIDRTGKKNDNNLRRNKFEKRFRASYWRARSRVCARVTKYDERRRNWTVIMDDRTLEALHNRASRKIRVDNSARGYEMFSKRSFSPPSHHQLPGNVLSTYGKCAKVTSTRSKQSSPRVKTYIHEYDGKIKTISCV